MAGLGLASLSAVVLAAAPLLFGVALEGRFEGGREVLTWTLMSACWFSMFMLAKGYLWCDERGHLVSIALLFGLVANIALNLQLLPLYGLYGAAASTCALQIGALAIVYLFSLRRGLRLDGGAILAMLLPACLYFGPWPAMALLLGASILAGATTWIFREDEKRQCLAGLVDYLCRGEALFAAPSRGDNAAAIADSDREDAPTDARAGHGRVLRVMFLQTTLDVGGAETLLQNILRGLDRARFAPELCCLKVRGELGEQMVDELPVFSNLLRHKFDLRVLPRLIRLFKQREIDAVVIVGAGDKMFWGRLAARAAGVPVVVSALHSTGWPDGIGRLNRMLTPMTDAFVAVAQPHGQHLAEIEGLPAERIHVIPNGVDTERFRPRPEQPALRRQLGIPDSAPIVGIVARLSYEKNHALFLDVAARAHAALPDAHFIIIGDGQLRSDLEARTAELHLQNCVHFLGNRSDVPELLSLMDLMLLTSHIEANPVSILEAFAAGKPVVATARRFGAGNRAKRLDGLSRRARRRRGHGRSHDPPAQRPAAGPEAGSQWPGANRRALVVGGYGRRLRRSAGRVVRRKAGRPGRARIGHIAPRPVAGRA